MSIKVGAYASGNLSAKLRRANLRGASAEAKVESKATDPAKGAKPDTKSVSERASDVRVKPPVDRKTVANARKLAGAHDAAAKERAGRSGFWNADNVANLDHIDSSGMRFKLSKGLERVLRSESPADDGGPAREQPPAKEPTKSEPAKTEPAKNEPVKTEPAKTETTKTETTKGPYSQQHLDDMADVIENGKMNMDTADEELSVKERTTDDGKVLDPNTAKVTLTSGNRREADILRTPNGEYYKKMGDGPAVKMTKAEVDKLKRNMIEVNPNTADGYEERIGLHAKQIYNDLVGPERAIDAN